MYCSYEYYLLKLSFDTRVFGMDFSVQCMHDTLDIEF